MSGVARAEHYVNADIISLSKRMNTEENTQLILHIKWNDIWFQAAAALNSEPSPEISFRLNKTLLCLRMCSVLERTCFL